MRTTLIIIGILFLARVLVLVTVETRPSEPVAPSAWATSPGPLFEVRILKPLSARPFGGFLPDGLFGLPPNELRFDNTLPGAEATIVAPDRLELSANGWSLFIEADGEGDVAPGSRLVFPIELGGNELTLRCRPADPASGYLRTTASADSDALDGSFFVEFATCANDGTGKDIEWPASPLTVRGSFKGLPHDRR